MKNNSFFIKNEDQHFRVIVEEILWLESIGTQCLIQTNKEQFFVNFSLNKLINKISSNQFVRIHQHFSINSEHMTSVDLLKNIVNLENVELPLGSTYKKALINRLNRI